MGLMGALVKKSLALALVIVPVLPWFTLVRHLRRLPRGVLLSFFALSHISAATAAL